jgi:peptidoglycan hydrolase CwlO-like protein
MAPNRQIGVNVLKRNKKNLILAFLMICILIGCVIPIRAAGKVKQITETQEKLEGITEEEKAVLEELFSINQKIEELETQEEKINSDMEKLNTQIDKMQEQIDSKQKDYDSQLDILKQVLVDYQRGGPATYFEILLNAEDLSAFLKSINVIKDISHNVKELLVTLKDAKKAMEEEKAKLDEKAKQLNQKQTQLAENLADNQALQEDKEAYLASLQEDKEYYEEQLDNLELMWTNCQSLFPELAIEITDTINDGYFTFDDLNMKLGLLEMSGYLREDTFNHILADKEELSDITFDFKEEQVVLNVPEEHLVLTGEFVIAGESAIRYEVTQGTFYDMPLEQSSIEELFKNGPLLIDFKTISEGIIAIEFTLNKVYSEEDKLAFEISPKW